MKIVIRLYQLFVSSMLPSRCRFFPSCSEYYCLAIEKHGELRGFLMFLNRIKKCHPWHEGGVDLP